MGDTFESRLGAAGGPCNGDKSDRSSSTADGVEESEGGVAPEGTVVLVVVDVNKELNMTAFNWTLLHVVQRGDTVRLLGVLHHIINPMGYKSRADVRSWNGASRKVLEHQIQTNMAILKGVPLIYTTVEKMGAKLEIDVRANPHSKNLVVEEANRLGARYVVIDRHIKKDKKFYIDNLSCYVTRVKTMTDYEHLRHGVPVVEDDCEATQTTDTSSGETSKSISLFTSQELSVPGSNPEALQASIAAPTPIIATAPMHHQMQAPSTAKPAATLRPSYSHNNSKPIYEDPLPVGIEYGPEAMGYSHQSPDRDAATMTRELAVRRWLVDSGYRMDPGFHYPAPDYGYMTTGYSAEAAMYQSPGSLSPFTEAAMADRMSNLFNSNSYASLPPLYARNESAESGSFPYPGTYPSVLPRSRESHVRRTNPTSSQSVQIDKGDAVASLLKLQGISSANNQVENSGDVGYDRGSSNHTRGPVSVQARRADTNWAIDLLNSDFGGKQQVHSAEMAHELLPFPDRQHDDSRCSENASEGMESGDGQYPVDRVSSVRRAVSSKKTIPETPPLCTICHQQSPVFGKVKKFTFAELQDATKNFSEENYLAKGGYGTVYRGRLKGGQLVAVKQHKLSSSQGDEEFCAEVEVLSCAQHRNLVTLIGYCVEKRMRLLVYEYVCNGSLDRHLSSKSKTELQWHHRHKIALGAASALRYLHQECRVGCIVHRDMRPNNILLTHDFTPMVGDFGLARRQTSGDLAEETRVLGTIGYLAPEYAETGQITDKADVYAFGVVLLELISGRKAIEHNRPKHQVSLTEWARPLLASYDKELVDPRLKEYNEFELHCMMHAATQCIKKDPNKRPRMTQVLRILNPPQERDWAYGPGRPTHENLSSSQTPLPALQLPPPLEAPPNDQTYFGSRYISSGSSSRSSSCTQSDLSIGSHYKPSD
ncbi:hypothetical protein M758_2G079500 [Ceratodon purpureus]|nr:hypothetical protein M758_2G079500 [Ceratodon purpureus]